MPQNGIYPVYKLKFKVGTTGITSAEDDMKEIKDMETFTLSIDGNVEEFTPMDTEGWVRRLMTGKAFTISLNGKRHVGDPGNDYVADTAWKDGLDCSTKGAIEFPSGAKLEFNCVINVKNTDGAESVSIAPLEFDLLSDGKPTYTPAA